MSNLYNVEIERHFFASLNKNPEQWGEVSGFMGTQDFSKIHQAIYDVYKLQLDQNKSIQPVIIAEIIQKYSVQFDGITPGEYLQTFDLIPVGENSCLEFAKEIKRLTVRRELVGKCSKLNEELKKSQDKSAEDMIALVDKELSDINVKYFQQETEEVFSDIIEVIEERGNNPQDAASMGFMGPFESINSTLGSLSYPSAFVCVGARTGNGKSSLGFYYNTWVAEKHSIPVLHLDAGEMTKQDLQMRATCALSAGKVPLWAVESGEWRKNKEYTDIIRGEVWPKVKNIKTYYKNIAGLSPKEFVSYIRRFYYNKIGRGNHLLIHWDYIKGTESMAKNAQEYQSIGYMIGDLKSMITTEITGSVWTSVQNNKMGIYNGKTSDQVNDSEESYSLSDRIIQQCTNAFTMRFKLPDEITKESNLYGNVILKSTKERKLLGKNYQDMISFVKIQGKDSSGKNTTQYKKNYFNLAMNNFSYEDKGSLKDMVEAMGLSKIKLKDSNDKPAF
jgi:replicative DNA helicase